MSQQLILVRHGSTTWNHEFRFQGHTDIELSSEGLQQAQALQRRFIHDKLEAIVSSDLSRAYQTAQIIAEPHHQEIIVDPDLREINFGSWEGLVFHDIERDYPELLKIWRKEPQNLKVPGAETFLDLQNRIFAAFQKLIQRYPTGTLLFVIHGGAIAALICALLKEPIETMWKYHQNNASVTIFTRKGQEILADVINDTSHLEALPGKGAQT